VRDRGYFCQHADEIERLVGRYPLVGHNLYFDIKMISEEFRKIGKKVTFNPRYCTMRDAWYNAAAAPPAPRHLRRELGSPPWRKLSELAGQWGVEPSGELHDAGVDARLAGECFIELAKRALNTTELAVNRARAELRALEAALEACRSELGAARRGVF
jgi:DNA polymerase III epsilon subunit-like protein